MEEVKSPGYNEITQRLIIPGNHLLTVHWANGPNYFPSLCPHSCSLPILWLGPDHLTCFAWWHVGGSKSSPVLSLGLKKSHKTYSFSSNVYKVWKQSLPFCNKKKLDKLKINTFLGSIRKLIFEGKLSPPNSQRQAYPESHSWILLPWSRSYWNHELIRTLKW